MMLPFLIIPLCMFTGSDGEIVSLPDGRLQPDGIEGLVRAADGTVITMKSGVVYITTLTIEQLEQHLGGYWKQLNASIEKAKANNIFKIN